MNNTELEELCRESIDGAREFGLPEEKASVALVTPPKWKAPPKFPRGYLLQVKDDGCRLWRFPSARVLRWLQYAGSTP